MGKSFVSYGGEGLSQALWEKSADSWHAGFPTAVCWRWQLGSFALNFDPGAVIRSKGYSKVLQEQKPTGGLGIQ